MTKIMFEDVDVGEDLKLAHKLSRPGNWSNTPQHLKTSRRFITTPNTRRAPATTTSSSTALSKPLCCHNGWPIGRAKSAR